MNRYQQEAKNPSLETKELQKQLNDFGYQDASGNPLKIDGVYGPKTDTANMEFENNFLGGLTNGKNVQKTVQGIAYPKLSGSADIELQKYILPKYEARKPFPADEYNLADRLRDDDVQRLPEFEDNVIRSIKKMIQQQKNAGKAGLQDEILSKGLESNTLQSIDIREPEKNQKNELADKIQNNEKMLYQINAENSKINLAGKYNQKSNNEDAVEKQKELEKKFAWFLDTFGMHYDDKDGKDFWYSTPDNFRQITGYGNIYDNAANKIGFDLNTDVVNFNMDGINYRFQVWDGNYMLGSLVPGAESGLYQEGQLTPTKANIYKVADKDKQVEMVIELWDSENNQQPLFTVDSTDYCQEYNNGKTYWQFGSKMDAGHIDKDNLYVKGTLMSEDKAILEAMAAAKSEKGDIAFGQVTEDPQNKGKYILTYTFVTTKKSGGGGRSW
jgi:peptidoglycan hydrolase-like protein with peptidoglycan-binding domain